MIIFDTIGTAFDELTSTIGREATNFVHTIDREVLSPGLGTAVEIGAVIGGVAGGVTNSAAYITDNILSPIRTTITNKILSPIGTTITDSFSSVVHFVSGSAVAIVAPTDIGTAEALFSNGSIEEFIEATVQVAASSGLNDSTYITQALHTSNSVLTEAGEQSFMRMTNRLGTQTAVNVVSTTGDVVQNIAAGASTGGALGAGVAPVSLGTSILIGAVIGGTLGLVIGVTTKFIEGAIKNANKEVIVTKEDYIEAYKKKVIEEITRRTKQIDQYITIDEDDRKIINYDINKEKENALIIPTKMLLI